MPSTGQYDVWCHICGHQWAEQDPGVTYHYDSATWECFDEPLCFERKAVAELDQQVREG